MAETPYVETEALLALLSEDEDALRALLRDLLPGELENLRRHAQDLAYRCRDEQLRRELGLYKDLGVDTLHREG